MLKYRTSQACYLRLKGSPPGTDPVLIEADTEIGEGTSFEFEGPPSMGMVPLTPAAEAAHASMLEEAAAGAPTMKETAAPDEGGAAPFDPASDKKDSSAEKEAEKTADKKTVDKK